MEKHTHTHTHTHVPHGWGNRDWRPEEHTHEHEHGQVSAETWNHPHEFRELRITVVTSI